MGVHGRRRQTREHLAYIAARLMAEDGIQDYATAKRKAARQAGAGDSADLPDNREIEAALRSFQALYQGNEQQQALRERREVAVEILEMFARFDPWLTGSVLDGTAGPHSDVNIQCFTDLGKDLELFLLNRGQPYDTAQKRVRLGDRLLSPPVFSIEHRGIPVNLTVFAQDDARLTPRPRDEGRPPERARLGQVRALLDDAPPRDVPWDA